MSELPEFAIAVVGLSVRAPGARDVEAFWKGLLEGRDGVTRGAADPQRPAFVPAAGALEGVGELDADFFGYSPLEAAIIDPQQRLFLECAFEALEHAGYPRELPGRPVGVFGGCGLNRYLLQNLASRADIRKRVGDYGVLLGNDKDFLATRVSYKLNLTGPSMTVQTACSTSLTAVAVASQALLDQQCDLALAGGVSLGTLGSEGYLHQEGSILSPDGRCRPFDAQADGTVPGDGAGVVVLKRLEDAVADGDTVHAVLRGWALNNDGAQKIGYTAPSVEGQARAVSLAQRLGGVDPGTLGYIEAHGTGTTLGDPIEVSALTRVFRERTGAEGFCALSSVKSNFGHLDAAAGVVGLIKAVLAVREGKVPGTLHFKRANPKLELAVSPFFVSARTEAWRLPGVRRAGVSSFGIGGTNAHVVLEQAPAVTAAAETPAPELLVLSARTAAGLEAQAGQLLGHLEEHPQLRLADVAHTLQVGRLAYSHRLALPCVSLAGARAALARRGEGGVRTGLAASRRSVAFLFPGQGSQRAGMARGHYAAEPVFRRELDACLEQLQAHLGMDVRPLLCNVGSDEAERQLSQTSLTQPALFAVEYALARQWMALGVVPEVMLGHSVGELVAACLAGVFRLEDALRLVCERGRLMQGMVPGRMLAVRAPADRLTALLGEALELAAYNAPELCVVSGPSAAVEELERRLAEEKVECRALVTSHAFHSRSMDAASARFGEAVARVARAAPSLPFVSNVTGELIRPEEATRPGYWAEQLRRPVQFSRGLSTVRQRGSLLLEVGPGRTLSALACAHPEVDVREAVPSSPSADADAATGLGLLEAAGALWVGGAELAFERLHGGGTRRRVPLPTYAFQRQRHWIEASAEASSPAPAVASNAVSLPAPDASLTPEQRVARLWQQLLGRERISPEEDFFSAGGHSLMAAQLKVQLDEEFHVLVPLADVLQASTIRAQAKLVSALVGTRGEPIPSLPPGAPRYASPAQERLWFLEELVPGNPALRIPELTRLTGPLDVAALRAAFDDLVARHDVLHCAVRSAPAGLVLEPRTPAPFTLPVEDLRGLAVEERLARAAELARAELGRPFDLGQPPFLRARLFHTDAQEHLLLLDVHHLIADRASLGVLAQELAVLYARRTGSSEAELPALRLSFADVATWQHHALGGPLLAAQADYWREALNGCEPVLELPTDAPRPALQTFRGARLHVAYPSALLEPVLSLGREVGASPFVTMLSAFGVLLHRRSGQSDFVVGAPFAGRERAELQGLVGCFVNTLPLRVRLEGDPGFRELLGRMRETALGAFSHAALPFEHIARQLRLKQDPSRPPLTQVLFTLENGQLPLPRAGSLTLAPLELDPGVAQAELLLHLETRTEGMVGWFEYNCALFTEATVAAMDAELRVLLAELAGRPGERVSRLRVLTPGDEAARWAAGAARATVPLREPSLQRAFQRQAERAPEAVALIDGERRYTYGELAAVANGLARRLWAAGVRPGARVLLWAERSAESVASILAILQCGAAYVPVDPAYPAERIRYLTGDCGASVALAPAGRGGLLPSGALRVLEVSAADFVATESEAVEGGASPSDAAYVIYTSGTTGKPKGVVVTHGNVLRLLTASEATFDFGPSDVWTLFHSLAFDFSVWELWGALAYGGSLLVVGDEAKDARAFAEALVHHRVTVLSQTPSAFRPLMLEPGLERGALRYVVFGGEALEFASLRPWFERMAGKGPRLVNMYGITETTVHVTAREVRPEEAAGARPSLIGAPLADLELHVLDGQLRPVPVGVVGELHVGGAGLALGYLHRPGLTAERFVPHPVREGARLYKSGDLARVLPGGDVEYCGRSDQQVKVRGFRIELGEIEAALLGHPGVLDARVLPLRQEGETRLVAYLRPRAEPAPEPRALRAFLRETLPEYMVPWRFVPVQDLELTAHGKLDTRALPVPSFNEPESAADASSLPALAGTATQQRVGGIFRELLGLAHVGLDDDFFDLGGHSLMAARLVTRLREHHGVSLPLRAFFDKPTVREVSRKLDEARAPQAPAEVTVRAQRGGPLPLSAAQRDIFLFEQLQSGSAAFHVPMCARLRGPLDLGVLERALARVLARHEVLRSRFDVYGGTPGQLPTDDCASRLEVRDLRGLSPDARERAWRDELPRAAAAPFDLRREAPLRTQVWRLSEDEHVVLFVLHHLACDGWSVGLFLDELRGAFERVQAGTAEPAPLRLQVADHAAAQTQQDASAEALAFWRQGLAGVSALAPLPTDHARGEKRSLRGAVQPVEVVGPAWTALRRLGAEERATPYMVAAALYVLALRGRGLDEVLLGSPVGARGAVALEPLIGCFLNTVLLRVKPALELSFRELLRAVREHTLAVLANADVPFAQVRQTCLPARREGNPFHAWLVLQNAPRVFPALPGVAVEPVEVPPPELKFELALELTETARGLEGQLAYQATLFEPETMSAFAATLQALATAAGDAPDAPVGALMEEQQRAERARRESQARSSLQSLRGRRGGAVKSQEHHDED